MAGTRTSPTPKRSRTVSTETPSNPTAPTRTSHKSAGRCFICQTKQGPFHENHVAGKPNAPLAVVDLCIPCHNNFTALQRSTGIVKPGRKLDEYVPLSPFGRVVALAQGGILHLILAARKHPELDSAWEPHLDRLSRAVTDLAAAVERADGKRVPLPDPLADDGDPA